MSDFSKLTAFRKELHQYPEVSGYEVETAKRVNAFLLAFEPDEVIEQLGGTGIAAIYNFGDEGKTILIRCELDALPIQEVNNFAYKSTFDGVSHKCGHDGHMAIVAGLGYFLKEANFKKGKVILLFQPAEETGKGAEAILKDMRFKRIEPDYVFSLHNIPGYPKHEIISIANQFSATVQSVSIKLFGKESHAAEPENGINPAVAISELIQEYQKLEVREVSNENFAILTPVYIQMGKKEYGISAGYGEFHLTLRTWSVERMNEIIKEVQKYLESIAQKHNLTFETEWFDYFPATLNDAYCKELVEEVAEKQGFNVLNKAHSFKFGEDFSWFTQKYPGAMFGLGAGEETPALHNADYDFPDEIIETGVLMFWGIIEKILR